MDSDLRKLERSLAKDLSNLPLRTELLRHYMRLGLVTKAKIFQAAALGDSGAIEIVGKRPPLTSLSDRFYIYRGFCALVFARQCWKPAWMPKDGPEHRIIQPSELFGNALNLVDTFIQLFNIWWDTKQKAKPASDPFMNLRAHGREHELQQRRFDWWHGEREIGYYFFYLNSTAWNVLDAAQRRHMFYSDQAISTASFGLAELLKFIGKDDAIIKASPIMRRDMYADAIKPLILKEVIGPNYPVES